MNLKPDKSVMNMLENRNIKYLHILERLHNDFIDDSVFSDIIGLLLKYRKWVSIDSNFSFNIS